MLRGVREFWEWLRTPQRTVRSVVEELVAGLRSGDVVLDPPEETEVKTLQDAIELLVDLQRRIEERTAASFPRKPIPKRTPRKPKVVLGVHREARKRQAAPPTVALSKQPTLS